LAQVVISRKFVGVIVVYNYKFTNDYEVVGLTRTGTNLQNI